MGVRTGKDAVADFVAQVAATYEVLDHHHFHFRDGKISRYRGSEDTLQTLGAFKA